MLYMYTADNDSPEWIWELDQKNEMPILLCILFFFFSKCILSASLTWIHLYGFPVQFSSRQQITVTWRDFISFIINGDSEQKSMM